MARPRTKAAPFSIRLAEATDRFVTAEAHRTKRSKGSVVEALTEEAARMRRFPGIAFRGDEPEREAWVLGSGLDVWEIIELLRDYGSAERLAAETALTERQVGLASAYYESYVVEVDDRIAENSRTAAEWRDLYPFLAGSER
jgi:hypothetical protein